ncbi:sensor histidine kinase [Croceivirga thetidis]|uniref:Histidine kinase n=1 Tax=Croceivirga thetidis TaxID=2721623 RepID=A0ABX1GQX5_9FLAO|nr:histidine kinase [Croceivirga thetidis]NKI32342.1 histidine kinase [Croceivirga thetidis]
MLAPFSILKSVLSIRVLRVVLVVLGVIIVFFNDSLGKIEGFVEFLLFYFIVALIALFHWLFVNIRFIINLKNEKTKTELMHLQSQVNPHFFFNMLNNLYGLVDKDSEKAKMLILKLSDMMRYSIYEGQKTQVTLGEEIEFLQNYIALHKMRYHKNIEVVVKQNVANEKVKIAPLLFIILVENAFKHGVEKLRKDAFVHITITGENNQVSLEVENNFDMEEQQEKGIGLQNLKRRLELAYPKKHQFEHSIEGNSYKTYLSLSL